MGDYLSYQQDVIATEAYLGTARRRPSVRRHARLIDYLMHDGCNARVWVQIQVKDDIVKKETSDPSPLPRKTQLLTLIPGQDVCLSSDKVETLQATQPEIFETIDDIDALYQEHNELHFYTWGARECCLPKGATRATLQGHLTHLKPGQILIFKEVIGPRTGNPYDADTTHRCAVRLTNVTYSTDPLGSWFASSSTDDTPPQETTVVNQQKTTNTRWSKLRHLVRASTYENRRCSRMQRLQSPVKAVQRAGRSRNLAMISESFLRRDSEV